MDAYVHQTECKDELEESLGPRVESDRPKQLYGQSTDDPVRDCRDGRPRHRQIRDQCDFRAGRRMKLRQLSTAHRLRTPHTRADQIRPDQTSPKLYSPATWLVRVHLLPEITRRQALEHGDTKVYNREKPGDGQVDVYDAAVQRRRRSGGEPQKVQADAGPYCERYGRVEDLGEEPGLEGDHGLGEGGVLYDPAGVSAYDAPDDDCRVCEI